MKNAIIPSSLGLTHPSVQGVLKIAEEIVSNNKVLNIDKLYNVAKRRLKLPRKGLLNIIHFLLNKKILFEGSKFTKDSVLKNSCRLLVNDFINKNPGSHFSLIRREVFLDETSRINGTGQLIWHIEMLLKFSYIKKIKIKNYTVFIPFNMDERRAVLFFFLRDDINRKIIRILTQQNSVVKSNIHKIINEKRESVYYRINNLLASDIINYYEEKNKILCINPALNDILNEILKNVNANDIT